MNKFSKKMNGNKKRVRLNHTLHRFLKSKIAVFQ